MNARKAVTQGRPIKVQHKSQFIELAFDLEPIAGVGESLIPLEAELRRIDEETKLKISQTEQMRLSDPAVETTQMPPKDWRGTEISH